MAGEALGLRSYFQFGLEATYGTAVAATKRLGYVTSRTTVNPGVILDPTLDNSVSRTAQYQGRKRFRTVVRTRLDYEGQLLLWDALFGTATFGSVGGTTTGASPFVHTFVEKTLLNSLTLQLIEGDPSALTNDCSRAAGAKLIGVTVRGEQGDGERGVGYADWEFTSKTYDEDILSTGALSAPAAKPVLYQEATTFDDGTADAAADVKMRSYEFSIRNPVEEEGVIGSATIEEPFRNNFVEVKARFTKLYKTKTLHAAANAFTAGSPKLVFGSAATKRITFDIGTANVEVYEHPVTGYGAVLQEVTWNAIKDVTNASAMKLVVENTQSTIN